MIARKLFNMAQHDIGGQWYSNVYIIMRMIYRLCLGLKHALWE